MFIFVFIFLKKILYFKIKYFDSDRIIEILIFKANNAFNNLIVEQFNKAKFNFIPKRRMDINANNLILFNRTKLLLVINYINEEINPRFIKMNIYSRKITTKKKV